MSIVKTQTTFIQKSSLRYRHRPPIRCHPFNCQILHFPRQNRKLLLPLLVFFSDSTSSTNSFSVYVPASDLVIDLAGSFWPACSATAPSFCPASSPPAPLLVM